MLSWCTDINVYNYRNTKETKSVIFVIIYYFILARPSTALGLFNFGKKKKTVSEGYEVGQGTAVSIIIKTISFYFNLNLKRRNI